jgi:hypothetical protein
MKLPIMMADVDYKDVDNEYRPWGSVERGTQELGIMSQLKVSKPVHKG